MITKNEISSLNLSPTKKDFVQIWNELIEVASKITERWDPTSTNESDPGIVLLKVLTGIADKLNYNIDKNILEAYMPTAAQMESMRKLCELVGYDIKYYQSAETKVRISYTGNTTDLSEDNEEKLPESGLALPKFTTITNADKDITFVTTNTIPLLITNNTPWTEVPCIEGQISQCESLDENNLITYSQLDNNKYYLPEIQVAENGIFVYNAVTTIDKDGNAVLSDGDTWTQVSNLNTQSADMRVFKFGYDSTEGRPYLMFPDDVGSLIGDGLFIYFIRTSGLSGNISPRTLEVLEVPTGGDWDNYSAEQFEVVNVDAATNGANIESISAAYGNFKKTVGTFDTLVTCRDYMNKIYSLMDANNSPYVSNILVTDIRSDINNSVTLCSCNEFGILYKETPLTKTVANNSSIRTVEPTDKANVYKLVISKDEDSTNEIPLIDHFDLILYPFKTFNQVSSGTKDLVKPYNRSFTYTNQMDREIEAALEDLKTCAHSLQEPAEGDIVSINNYLRLNALIATSTKVSEVEANDILKNVKVALVNEFNSRNLDFGEEIPFDSILSVIENADARIKVVSLQEPAVLTTYSVKAYDSAILGSTSKEYGIIATADADDYKINEVDYEYDTETATYKCTKAKEIYNKLVIRNLLAGRAELFDYDDTFVANNSEKPYKLTKNVTEDFKQELAKSLASLEAELRKDNPEITDAELSSEKSKVLDESDESIYSINRAIAVIMDKKEAGDFLLYNNNGLLTGFNNGTLTLKVFEHTHTLSWEKDKDQHWQKCSNKWCEANFDKAEHIYDQRKFDEINHWYECICGAKNDILEHDELSLSAGDEKNHWYQCSCGFKKDIIPHVDNDGDKLCDSCGRDLSGNSEVAAPEDNIKEESSKVEKCFIYQLYETYEYIFAAPKTESTDEAAPATFSLTRATTSTNDGIINNIKRVEAVCELTNTAENNFTNITLDKNEVIKFRAPNLITTKTFPAYVYYNFERGTEITSNGSTNNTTETITNEDSLISAGRPAKVKALSSFITAINRINANAENAFFDGLWAAAKTNAKLESFDFYLDRTGSGINQADTLPAIFRSAIVVYTDNGDYQKTASGDYAEYATNAAGKPVKFIKNNDGLYEESDRGEYRAPTQEEKNAGKWNYLHIPGRRVRFASAEAAKRYMEVAQRASAYTLLDDENIKKQNGIVFNYCPLVAGAFPLWSNYIKECYINNYSDKLKELLKDSLLPAELPGDTILWRLSSSSNFPEGELVTNSGQKLYAQSGDFLTGNDVGSVTYICTDLGANPKFASVPKNSDIELRRSSGTFSGDKLYIHYTPSSTNEDGETVTAEAVSIVYTSTKDEPLIIKPSFELIPSEDVYNQGTSWKKTDVDFVVDGKTVKKNLLALGANEQIELRSISRVILNTPARFYKNFDNALLENGDSTKNVSYELKDGEYIFYTDINTQAAAYYGSGSVITLTPGAYIPKVADENKVEVSQILEQGLHIVPWGSHVLLDDHKTVTVTEYQYVTLVEGDTLNSLALAEATNGGNGYKISNDWVKCEPGQLITYTPSGAENPTELPKIELSSGTSTGWEVCSLLELSTSPGYTQTLRAAQAVQKSTKASAVTITDKIKIYQENETTDTGMTATAIEIAPQQTTVPAAAEVTATDDNGAIADSLLDTVVFEPVSIKLSTIIQSASGNFEKSENTTETANSENEDAYNIKLKVFKEEAPAILTLDSDGSSITPISSKQSMPVEFNSANINNYWTKLDVTSSLIDSHNTSKVRALNLNFMIPEDSDLFGIFSIYLDVPDDRLDSNSKQGIPKFGADGEQCRVFIDVPREFGNYEEVIRIYNYEKKRKSSDTKSCYWWTEGVDQEVPNRLYLRTGLNCIQVRKSCNLLIQAQADAAGSILYDNLRLIKGRDTHGVNLELIDFDATSITKDDINEVALAEALLKNIAVLDKNYDFYYNVPIENSLAMEFDNNISSFSNPYTLYDINNINNNFVISKLDVNYLDTGLKIAKSSRY